MESIMARLPKSIIKKYGISKKAWRVFKGKKRKSRSRKTKTTRRRKRGNPKKGGKSMSRGKSLVQTATQLAKAGAVLAPVVIAATSKGDLKHKAVMYLSFMSGVDVGGSKPRFRWDRLLVGWGPYVGVSVGSKIASKINGLIRRI